MESTAYYDVKMFDDKTSFALTGGDQISIKNKKTNKEKFFKIGTQPWRILYFTQFRKNAEGCTNISSEMPYDVQQDIANYVWNNFESTWWSH